MHLKKNNNTEDYCLYIITSYFLIDIQQLFLFGSEKYKHFHLLIYFSKISNTEYVFIIYTSVF